ncbi:TPA: hypothetical protein KNO10_001806 [Clostridioides difficile]|uniref:hypothetical protein n=2 Tax=Clostridioides difficile TaxID=1496 RepID=UPI00097FE374|nr:hypothetical protein [Clostridioides difficile]SJR11083.1 Uncharacterised protein [Clostridioides difficile]HBF0728667.1 hypothetical protein [Clostridioides difficile]HBF6040145.1 hypothetical protein [Clostridioides difficile]HBF7389518.1 hypothetical protein [Clostridioides difficile]HBG3350860.1 hypothetical protein [Clostridioides difficile]
MNYITTQGFDTIKRDKIEIKRMVYALENEGDSYNVIEECICTLEENIDVNDDFVIEVENVFSFVIDRIMDFIKEKNLPKNKIEHVRAYIDVFENPTSNTKIVKSIDIYEDYDKRYIDNKLDKLFKSMDNMIKPEFVPVIDGKFDIRGSKDLKEYNKKLMLDIVKQKTYEVNNGGIRINKLSAILKLGDKSIDGISKMMKDVANLKIKPKSVYISEDTVVVMYICNKSCIVLNIEEYSKILSDFVDYINNIEDMDLYLDDSILYGDYKINCGVDDRDIIDFNYQSFNSKVTLFAGHIGNEIIQAAL